MSSWEYSSSTTIEEKKKLLQAGLDPKLSELTELIVKFFFDLENILAVIHISKKCAKMSVFYVKIVKIRWLVGAEHQAP